MSARVRPHRIFRQKFPKRTRVLSIPSKPCSFHSAHSAIGRRMNRMQCKPPIDQLLPLHIALFSNSRLGYDFRARLKDVPNTRQDLRRCPENSRNLLKTTKNEVTDSSPVDSLVVSREGSRHPRAPLPLARASS